MDLRELLRKQDGAKRENRQKILRAVMSRAGNQTELVRRSGLSSATVSEAVRELQDSGLVQIEQSGRDKLVSLVPVTGAAIGVELGYQETVIVGRLAHQDRSQRVTLPVPYGSAAGEQNWLAETVRGIQHVVGLIGEDAHGIATIGLGVPRMVTPKRGDFAPPRLPPWENAGNPAEVLATHLAAKGAPPAASQWPAPLVLMDNDANLGALAESTHAHPDKETLLYVKASTGVGGGICVGGKLFRGANGVAGEIGHVMIDRDGRFCQCGGRGCLETLIGSDVLVRNARTILGGRTSAYQKLDQVIERAQNKSAVCIRVLREAGALLGQTIGNVCNILDPDIVVFGGNLAKAGKLVFEPCREAINTTALAAVYESGFELVPSTIEHASAEGALLLGIEGTVYP